MATIARCLIAFFFVTSGSGKIKNIAIIGGLINFVAS
jgi:hypothetical protein